MVFLLWHTLTVNISHENCSGWKQISSNLNHLTQPDTFRYPLDFLIFLFVYLIPWQNGGEFREKILRFFFLIDFNCFTTIFMDSKIPIKWNTWKLERKGTIKWSINHIILKKIIFYGKVVCTKTKRRDG